MLGRDFVPADEVAGAAPVAILAYRFWESRFGKRADIVGATVRIDGTPATIIGVMPEGFDFPHQTNIWLPASRTPKLLQRGLGGYLAVGRLRDGARVQQARAELATIHRRLQAAYPATSRDLVLSVIDNAHFHAGPEGETVYGSLWAGAWLVLLIACGNLANLSVVRTMGRWREFSTRIALGAGPGRMMRQMVVESLMLAGVAGALAWWLTNWSVRTWAVANASVYQVLDYRVDAGTLAYLVAISVIAALLCSLAPIARIVQLGVSGPLKGDARGVARSLRGKHLGAVLVTGQMTLAIVLLSGAGVLVRSLLNVVNAETGVRDPGHVLVGALRFPSDKSLSADTQFGYFNRLEARLRSIPGVERESGVDRPSRERWKYADVRDRGKAGDGGRTVCPV